MYMTDNAPANGAQSANRPSNGEVLRQDRILAVEDEPRHRYGARERLPGPKSTLGIEPRRSDSGVGGRLVEGFARPFRVEREAATTEDRVPDVACA
jgi:hypothetical protein